MKKYQIIYADPPWSYQNGGVPQGGVNAQYKTMRLEDIKRLPVSDIADDPCVEKVKKSKKIKKEINRIKK